MRALSLALYLHAVLFCACIVRAEVAINNDSNSSRGTDKKVDSTSSADKGSGTTVPAYELQKMVVSPSRTTPQAILDVPQAVTVIDGEALGATVKTGLNEYLQTIPGVTMAPSGGADSSNRNSDYWNSGFSLRGLGAQRVLVLSDGVRQSGQGVGYGGGNLSLYDPMSIERVEVLKGPASVLYGTDAFGGVVQVFTHDPSERENFGINGRLRSAYDFSRETRSNGGYVDVGDKNYGIVIGGSHTTALLPNLPDGHQAEGGSYTKDSGFGKFVYRPTQDSQFRLLANIVTARDINIFDDSSPGLGKFLFKIPFYQRVMVGAEYEKNDLSEHIAAVKLGVYHQQLKRRFEHATPDFFVGAPPFTDDVKTNDTVRTTELQGQVALDFAPHRVTVGTDVGLDTSYLPEVSSQTGYKLKADAAQTRVGVYAQDLWTLDQKNLLTLGARGDYFLLADNLGGNDKNGQGVSGSIGYTHKIDPKTSVYATLATGFRSPDLAERYQDTTFNFFNQAVTVRGNADLQPERSYSLDIGAKHEAAYGEFEVGGFFNNVHDFIGLVPGPLVGVGGGLFTRNDTNENVGTVDLFGFEAGWRSAESSNWKNYLNISRTWTDSDTVVALPSYVAGYGVGYRFAGIAPFHTVTAQWMGRLEGPSDDTLHGNTHFGGFHTADAQVAFEFQNPTITRTQLIVGVKNVFNRLYMEPFYAQYSAGRGFFAALQVDF